MYLSLKLSDAFNDVILAFLGEMNYLIINE